ncbi:MAG: hypothetical protein IJ091_09225 [Oscillospiraceae bacterium]|nr:hypothetical protein [Oscillospiraceae bacterium]
MKKTFALLLFSILLLTSCGKAPQEPQTDPEPEVKRVERYRIENALDAFQWAGKTMEQIGIGEEYRDYGGVDFSGTIFGGEIFSGTAYFGYNEDRDRFREIYLIVSEDQVSKEDMLEGLKALYGEPFSENEEPYAAANGGVVFRYDFYTGTGTASFSYGEKNSFSDLRFLLSDPPELPEETDDGEWDTEDFLRETGYLIDTDLLEAEGLEMYRDGNEDYAMYDLFFQRGEQSWTAAVFKDQAEYPEQYSPERNEEYEDFSEGGVRIFVSEHLNCTLVFWREGEDVWMLDLIPAVTPEEAKLCRELLRQAYGAEE